VGNTGNAKNTPPHLHFGIYKRGPIDPYHFISSEYKLINNFEPNTSWLGKDIQLEKEIMLKSQMSKKSLDLDTLKASDQLRILAVNHKYVRVLSNEGVIGFVNKDEVEVR
jgi:murein DD-endopeptidase MepM/ murein hydrolase activator NlpD